MNHWIKILGVVALGVAVGVMARGYSDAQGWTTPSLAS